MLSLMTHWLGFRILIQIVARRSAILTYSTFKWFSGSFSFLCSFRWTSCVYSLQSFASLFYSLPSSLVGHASMLVCSCPATGQNRSEWRSWRDWSWPGIPEQERVKNPGSVFPRWFLWSRCRQRFSRPVGMLPSPCNSCRLSWMERKCSKPFLIVQLIWRSKPAESPWLRSNSWLLGVFWSVLCSVLRLPGLLSGSGFIGFWRWQLPGSFIDWSVGNTTFNYFKSWSYSSRDPICKEIPHFMRSKHVKPPKWSSFSNYKHCGWIAYAQLTA